jgi:hypothetical protein
VAFANWPPTWPAFERNSSMTLALKSAGLVTPRF